MPQRTDIKSILLVGSGPIVIGQACEFDYSGTQACRALREMGYKVILLNSNPATIMTDPEMADRTYVEPITPETLEAIIAREKPDALLPTMGGQTSLNAALECHRRGILEKYGVELIGASVDAIETAEDRELFKKAMDRIGLEMPRGGFARDLDGALLLVQDTGYPAIIRPAFTMGGTGGSIAYNIEEYREKVAWGLAMSPIGEVLVEESVIGWKEFELEVMRDRKDNVVIICSIENLDAMGIHTGDSITVAPAQTLTDREYQAMRDAALKVIREIGVETGGCNIQFSMDPKTGRLCVIEMNPRVSRSSALASKATGFPIAKIAAQVAVGLTLDEIPNDITGKTPACFEPALDYVVVKVPRWDFEKFPQAEPLLGTQMKSVGEAMAFGRTFDEALGKALRSMETGRLGYECRAERQEFAVVEADEGEEAAQGFLADKLRNAGPERLYWLCLAMEQGLSRDQLMGLTGLDQWFLDRLKGILEVQESTVKVIKKAIQADSDDQLPRQLRRAKRAGLGDALLAHAAGTTEEKIEQLRKKHGITPVFKTVDTCAAEFESNTPYFYSTYETENEVVPSDKQKVIILGGGPNRIGQGIEFDYCAVRTVLAFKEEGWETIMVNCNPETVSTDYDIADRLYFEPLTFEDVMNVVEVEKPYGVVVQVGGQTPLRLAHQLEQAGVRILGTSVDNIDLAEDRKRFGALLQDLGIKQPNNGTAFSFEEARQVADEIGYPVLVRPSYVLGGRGMEIVYDRGSLRGYIEIAAKVSPNHPILIDRFLEDAVEVDVDAVSDGETVYVGGIMQHIEEAGIHSGDSSCVLPPFFINPMMMQEIRDQTRRLALALDVRGLINIQFAIYQDQLHVLEVNPRASRTVPFVAKATGVPLAKLAAQVMSGRKLKEFKLPDMAAMGHVCVKTPVFPFLKFPGVKNFLGPEMKSTGEVMGAGKNFGIAFAKAQQGAGYSLPEDGRVFISVNPGDKDKIAPLARAFVELGFTIIATPGTAAKLAGEGLSVETVHKVHQDRPNVVDRLVNGDIQLVVNTPLGKASRFDERAIGRTALARNIPCLTTLAAGWAAVEAIRCMGTNLFDVRCLQELHRD